MNDAEQNRAIGDQIIRRLVPLATTGGKNIGGKEARLLIHIGCDVVEHAARVIFGEANPRIQEALQVARAWADGHGDLHELERLREPLINWTARFCPTDSAKEPTEQDRARETCANAIATIIRACRNLDVQWTRATPEGDDQSDYARDAAASVLLVICPITARALMVFGGKDDWREIQTELNQIAVKRLGV